MEKLTKTARVLKKIIKVLRGLSIGFGVACAVLLVIGIFLPDSLYDHFVNFSDMSINIGNVMLKLSRAVKPNGSMRLFTCFTLADGAAVLALSAFGLHLLYKILSPMAEGRPFDGSVALNLKKLAWVTLAGIIAFSVLGSLASWAEIAMFNIDELFAPGLVTGYTISYTTDGALLLIPAALFLLSYIFQYGEELQRQSDETL